MDQPRGRDHGHVAAVALDLGDAERDQLLAVRHLPRDAIEPAVLEDEHGVGIADRGLQQAAHVGGRGRDADLQAGRLDKPEAQRLL